MPAWRIELFGGAGVLRDGEGVRLRTNLQFLLLARLAVHHPLPIDRSSTAELLWPEASAANRASYLRRALMELRQLGLEVISEGGRIGLPAGVSSDFGDYVSDAGEGAPGDAELLPGIDHAIADEARTIWRRHVEARLDYGEAEGPGAEKLRLWLVERLIEENPGAVLATLVAHGPEMIYQKPTEGLLDLYLEVLEKVGDEPPEALKLKLYAAHVAGILTRYTLAKRLLHEVIDQSIAAGRVQEETSAYGSMAHLSGELHDFEGAMQYGQMAVDKAMATDNPRSASGALINLGHVFGQQLRYEEAVASFLRAFELAESIDFEGQKSVALASLAFYWGVLGCDISPEIMDQAKKQAGLGYMAMVDAYTQFSLAVGNGDAALATSEAKAMLRLTSAEGMERMFYVALDNCAIALAMQGRGVEAAAVVRVGTRYRRSFQGGRSPVEKQVIRRHVSPPFFGREIEEMAERMPAAEPGALADEVGELLE